MIISFNYITIINLLTDKKKTHFKNAYDTYITDYNALQKLVQEILAKQELVTEKDKDDIKNAKKNYLQV